MLDSLSSSIVEQIKQIYGLKGHVEGTPEGGWVITDFGDVVVHLFSPDQRDYYRLEELWEKGRVLLHVQ